MGKVKSEAVRRYHRTPLLNLLTQHFPESRLEYMGSGMVAGNIPPAFFIYMGSSRFRYLQAAIYHSPLMQKNPVGQVEGIFNLKTPCIGYNLTGIAHLSAHFGIKRALIQHYAGLVTLFYTVNCAALGQNIFNS